MLAKSKLNSLGTSMSQALIDLGISHEDFKTILNEKERYEKMKENITSIKGSDEKDKLSENSGNNKKNIQITYILLKNIFLFCAYKMLSTSVQN